MRKVSLMLPLLILTFAAEGGIYRDPKAGFQVEFEEAAWEIAPQKPAKGAQGHEVDDKMAQRTLLTLQRKVADDRYHARFSVVIDDLEKFKGTPTEQLLQYRKHALDFLKSQRFTIQSTTERKVGSIPGFEIQAHQRDFGLTFLQVGIIQQGKAFLLTGAARTTAFANHQTTLRRLIDSFQLTR